MFDPNIIEANSPKWISIYKTFAIVTFVRLIQFFTYSRQFHIIFYLHFDWESNKFDQISFILRHGNTKTLTKFFGFEFWYFIIFDVNYVWQWDWNWFPYTVYSTLTLIKQFIWFELFCLWLTTSDLFIENLSTKYKIFRFNL